MPLTCHPWRRLFIAVQVVVMIELGLLLVIVPWTSIWDHNYFALHSIRLSHLLLSAPLRGATSGLGFLNLWHATGEVARR